MSPAVSVIIPVYERADLIGASISSVLGQTFSDYELIIIDDGSGPSLQEAVGKFNDPRIRFLRHDERLGAAAARNTGIKAARANLIAFLDSDDEWLPKKLEIQTTFLAKAPNCRACVTAVYICSQADEVERIHIPAPRRNFSELLFVCDLSPGTTLVADRALFTEAGLFSTDFQRFEDWDWLLRCVEYSPIETVAEPLARIHVGSWPSLAVVRTAAKDLLRSQSKNVQKIGLRARFRFHSSLFYEISVAAFKQRSYVLAAFYLALSVLLCPAAPRGVWRRLRSRMFPSG